MFDVAIYSKTALGRQEVAERKLRLHPRLRSALIMIDGKTPYAQLRDMLRQLGEPADLIQQLSAMRLIESDFDLPEIPDFTQSRLAYAKEMYDFQYPFDEPLTVMELHHPTR